MDQTGTDRTHDDAGPGRKRPDGAGSGRKGRRRGPGEAGPRAGGGPFRRLRGRRLAARGLAGLLSALLALASADLIAALLGGVGSPFFTVGSVLVDSAPKSAKDLTIALFGTNDKLALFGLMALVIAAVAVAAGILERRRRPVGSAILLLFGVVGVVSAVTRAGATPLAAVPTVAGVVLGVLALRLMTGAIRRAREPGARPVRRDFLRLSLIVAATSLLAGGAGRVLGSGGAKNTGREGLKIPAARTPVAIAKGAQLDVAGVTEFVTPNADFYRIDTALQVPRIDVDSWRLRIHGMVEKEMTLSFADLIAGPLVEKAITLTCVSNEVGGNLAGNAVWRGYPIHLLLAAAGVDPDADMVLSASHDGFTASTPLSALDDPGRDAILAVSMNGQPLPFEHGFPVRMVVPGLYGYVSATKWLVDLEVTRFDKKQAYWTPRGYAEQAPIKLASRIDVPKSFASLKTGKIVVAGVAWAQHTGIRKVEVRFDGGPWHEAELATAHSDDTWREWKYDWDAEEAGNHYIYVRATDKKGMVQTDRKASPLPDGASGWHSRLVRLS